MTDRELAAYLRAVRAERKALQREMAQLEAEKPPVVVTVRSMTTADVLKLLLEVLEAKEPPPQG